MQSKHAWDRVVALTWDVLKDYRAIQPYLEQAIRTGTMRTEAVEGGTRFMYVASISGHEIEVRLFQAAGEILRISDAWVRTR